MGLLCSFQHVKRLYEICIKNRAEYASTFHFRNFFFDTIYGEFSITFAYIWFHSEFTFEKLASSEFTSDKFSTQYEISYKHVFKYSKTSAQR